MTSYPPVNSSLLRVAPPRVRNGATMSSNLATNVATGVQQPSLKALALLRLSRNNSCNNDARNDSRSPQQLPVSIDTYVALILERERLLHLGLKKDIKRDLIDNLPEADVGSCSGLPDDILKGYVEALRDTSLRERGKCPRDETEPALCIRCGPIWTAPEIARAAPIINRIPTVLGCPWCHVKRRETIPRPQVICGSCSHFTRDVINPFQGMGHCIVGCDPDYGYPAVKRTCASWRPIAS